MRDTPLTAPEVTRTESALTDKTSGMATNFLQVLVVPASHPALAGHFPGRPIVPGVVLLDHTVLALRGWLDQPAAALPCEIASAKFLSPVTPGEPLELDASLTQTASENSVRFEIRSGARRIASGVVKFKRQ